MTPQLLETMLFLTENQRISDDITVVEAIRQAHSERCDKQMENDDEQTNMRDEFHIQTN